MKSKGPSVYIIDDDRAVRESLALILELRGYSAFAFPDGDSFLGQVKSTDRGCILLDLCMPGLDGLNVQAEFNARGVTMPVIILTAHGDVEAARAAFKGGAFDFLEKPVDRGLLLKAIDGALAIEQEVASKREYLNDLHARVERLTPRERQVLRLVVDGRHNREIAARLGISARTVEGHKARLMDKLHVDRLSDLIRLFLDVDRLDENA